MKILIVNYEFPPIGGGAGNATKNTARELVRSCSHEVVVLTAAFRGLPRRERLDGYEIVRIPTRRRQAYRCTFFEMFVFAVSLCFFGVRRIRAERPDIVLIYNAIPCGHVGLLCRWFLRTRYVLFLRGAEVPGHRGGPRLMHKLVFPLTWLMWRQAACVLANGQRLRDLAVRAVPSVDVHVVSNGVDTEMFRPDEREGGADVAPRFVYTGRLSPEKGLERLFDAIEEWLATRDQAALQKPIFTVIGDGVLMPTLKERAARLADRIDVRFTGWIDREQIAQELRSSDVYLSASYDEGVSNSILEALASGLVAILSDIEGHREIVENGVNGLLCRDTAEFAAALLRVEVAAERAGLRTAALRTAAERSWQGTARLLSGLLERAAS